jgi:hypothetical protein
MILILMIKFIILKMNYLMSKYDDPNQPKLNTYFKELKDKEMDIE